MQDATKDETAREKWLREQLAAERKRRDAQEESANYHAETVLLAGERLGMTKVGRDGLLASIGAVIARAEQAERERDAAREHAERESNNAAESLSVAGKWMDMAKRAEADNAALLGRIRSTKRLIETGQPLAALADIEEDERHGLTHPGAAMLERMRALEKVREVLGIVVPAGADRRFCCGGRRLDDLMDACAAVDALKPETK